MNRNQTRQDAHDRMIAARVGMLAGRCSNEYLIELRQLCYQMIEGIDAAIRFREETTSREEIMPINHGEVL